MINVLKSILMVIYIMVLTCSLAQAQQFDQSLRIKDARQKLRATQQNQRTLRQQIEDAMAKLDLFMAKAKEKLREIRNKQKETDSKLENQKALIKQASYEAEKKAKDASLLGKENKSKVKTQQQNARDSLRRMRDRQEDNQRMIEERIRNLNRQ